VTRRARGLDRIIGHLVAAERRRAGFSQAFAAALLGVHVDSVRSHEAGRTALTASDLARLADAYPFDAAALLAVAVDEHNRERVKEAA
jgi:transcriptional regulator with XRE-family HTH domain